MSLFLPDDPPPNSTLYTPKRPHIRNHRGISPESIKQLQVLALIMQLSVHFS